ncbi:hypothetical protein BC832DRAFT_561684 [Gaertneriomyces semiglobifer]|nr:hypothetical protein BC832DRAFT_561684 [Gaertneriomyces semiglobifer]
MWLRHLHLALSALPLISAAPASYDCNAVTPAGSSNIYNLSPLKTEQVFKNLIPKDSSTWIYDRSSKLFLGVCDHLNEAVPNDARGVCGPDTWACYVQTVDVPAKEPLAIKAIRIADYRPHIVERSNGIDLIYESTDEKSRANLSLICGDPAATPKIVSDDKRNFTVSWTHPAGCAHGKGGQPISGKAGMSFLSLFFLICFLLFAAYIVLGSVYNWTVMGIRHFPECIPNWDMWSTVLAVLWDKTMDVYDRIRGNRNYVAI